MKEKKKKRRILYQDSTNCLFPKVQFHVFSTNDSFPHSSLFLPIPLETHVDLESNGVFFEFPHEYPTKS